MAEASDETLGQLFSRRFKSRDRSRFFYCFDVETTRSFWVVLRSRSPIYRSAIDGSKFFEQALATF
ncbi:hypothetical protein CKA32_002513 [Geitlerinema sp. FC II]|nr:hypothetical protein CKA32_002513 [Geitlerinema sp. FC II]